METPLFNPDRDFHNAGYRTLTPEEWKAFSAAFPTREDVRLLRLGQRPWWRRLWPFAA